MTDRLALVCKLMLDHQVLALRREIEELRLRLFWKDHGAQILAAKMREANRTGPRCECDACVCLRHSLFPAYLFPAPPTPYECAFKPWFEALLDKHGLTHGDEAAHITHIDPEFTGPWVHFVYGRRLLDARSARDPELTKLSRLFEDLDILTGH